MKIANKKINCKAKFSYRINCNCKKTEKINAIKAESKLVSLLSRLKGVESRRRKLKI